MDDLKFDKWMLVLVFLAENHDSNISKLSEGIGGSYAHAFNLCSLLSYHKLITLNKVGRTTKVELTKSGWKSASYVKDMKKFLLEEK